MKVLKFVFSKPFLILAGIAVISVASVVRSDDSASPPPADWKVAKEACAQELGINLPPKELDKETRIKLRQCMKEKGVSFEGHHRHWHKANAGTQN